VNGWPTITGGNFPVRDLLQAYDLFCAGTDRIAMKEAWVRQELSATRMTHFLTALRDAFGVATIPLAAAFPAAANIQVVVAGDAIRNAIVRFDADIWTAMSHSGTIRLTAEERQVIPEFCNDMGYYTARLWPGRHNAITATTVQTTNYLRMLRKQLDLFGTDFVFNNFNTNYTKKTETNAAVQAAVGTMQALSVRTFDAWRAANGPRWTAIEDCINFWEAELPLARARAGDIRTLLGLAGAMYADHLFRNVTQGEVDALVNHNGFRQHAGKLEREKWFYAAGANPGAGVAHDFICDVSLRTGTIAQLQALSIARDDPAAMRHIVFVKPAEPNCYGIHEDALGAFNCCVQSIRITRRVGGALVRTINLAGWNAATLDNHYAALIAAVTLLLQ
jgi:hypothetical protein